MTAVTASGTGEESAANPGAKDSESAADHGTEDSESAAERGAEGSESVANPGSASDDAGGNCVVVSQTWLRAGEEHAATYLRLAADFDGYLTARPGFVRRFLVRSLDDDRHIIHWREFISVEAYEEMTADPEYQDHIAALSRHVDPAAYPAGAVAKEYGRIMHATPPHPPEP